MHQPGISVIVPVYNEAENVRPLAEETIAVLAERIPFELVFVDDGSSDGTPAALQELADGDRRISVQTHAGNRGQSAAVRTGVAAAGADIIAVMDGDGQNDPKDIPALYGRLHAAESIRMVIGERQKRHDSWLRKMSSRIANAVRARVLGDGIRDTGCGIKVFYRQDYLDLPAFNHMHRFLPALIQRNGGTVSSVPVNHRPRLHGVSKYGVNNRLWVGVADLLGVMWLQRRRLQ